MCDFFDDLGDFDNGGFMDDDSFDDRLGGEMDEPFTDDTETEVRTDDAESLENDFTAKDAFIIGGAMGFGYSEGLKERKKKRRKRLGDNDSD
jgi:hypothetical protein